MDENRVASEAKADRLWVDLRAYKSDILSYFSTQAPTLRSIKATLIAIQLINHELHYNAAKYSKYPPKDNSFEDFIKLAAIQPSDLEINYADPAERQAFMNEIREIMWGYIKKRKGNLDLLMQKMKDPSEEEGEIDIDMSPKDFECLAECLCVAYLESEFRQKELIFFEQECYKRKNR